MGKKERLMAKLQQLGGCDAKCRRCGKSAYANERLTIEKQFYHSNCITCARCGAKADIGKLKTDKEELYCPDCYKKPYGSKADRGGISDINLKASEDAQDTGEESPPDPKEAMETKGAAGSTEPADGVTSEDAQDTGEESPVRIAVRYADEQPQATSEGDQVIELPVLYWSDGDEAEAQGAPGSDEQVGAPAEDGQDAETNETAGTSDVGAEPSGATEEADA